MFNRAGYFTAFSGMDLKDTPVPLKVESGALTMEWRCICPACGIKHLKHWHTETDLCLKCQEKE